MAGKRNATSDLNHDNWNDDDEPEERGVFQKASEDALKTRVIRTAKRRNPISSVREDGEKKNIFASFTAFQNKPPSSDFSFINNVSKSNSPKVNGTEKPAASNIFSGSSSIFGAVAVTPPNASNKTVPQEGPTKSDTYFSKLKGLNESVSKWIVSKVEENPLISLQPIFKDYDKYLDEIEKEEQKNGEGKDPNSNSATLFNFGSSKNTSSESTSEKSVEKKKESPKTAPQFKFGVPPTSSVATTTPTFSFGSTPSFTSAKSFTLGTTPTFSFGSNSSGPITNSGISSETTAKSSGAEKVEEIDEDEPPKVTFTPVVEKDHIYTTRCKVFVKKDDSFSDRGVGSLFLKPIENSEKVQLIVRADTNLGQLLCNFILSESVPTKRMGKKDVMLVTIPTPNSQPPPVPILLRVKSSEDADKLLEVLEKHKK